MEGFLEKLGETIRDEADMHRLWYDLRSQSLFEEAFRNDVAEIDRVSKIWRGVSRPGLPHWAAAGPSFPEAHSMLCLTDFFNDACCGIFG